MIIRLMKALCSLIPLMMIIEWEGGFNFKNTVFVKQSIKERTRDEG